MQCTQALVFCCVRTITCDIMLHISRTPPRPLTKTQTSRWYDSEVTLGGGTPEWVTGCLVTLTTSPPQPDVLSEVCKRARERVRKIIRTASRTPPSNHAHSNGSTEVLRENAISANVLHISSHFVQVASHFVQVAICFVLFVLFFS